MRCDTIREMAGVVEISKKPQERQLYSYGRAIRREQSRCKDDAGTTGSVQVTQRKAEEAMRR